MDGDTLQVRPILRRLGSRPRRLSLETTQPAQRQGRPIASWSPRNRENTKWLPATPPPREKCEAGGQTDRDIFRKTQLRICYVTSGEIQYSCEPPLPLPESVLLRGRSPEPLPVGFMTQITWYHTRRALWRIKPMWATGRARALTTELLCCYITSHTQETGRITGSEHLAQKTCKGNRSETRRVL